MAVAALGDILDGAFEVLEIGAGPGTLTIPLKGFLHLRSPGWLLSKLIIR